jgi:hypothetical protein
VRHRECDFFAVILSTWLLISDTEDSLVDFGQDSTSVTWLEVRKLVRVVIYAFCA